MARRLALVLVATVVVGSRASMPGATAGPLDPQVDQRLVATFVGDEITLTGSFGAGVSQSLVFTYAGGTTTLASTSALVEQWDVGTIKTRIPTDVRSGTLAVVIDGRQSAPVDIYVYETTQVSTQLPSNRDSLPLALAIAPNQRIWINDEFQTYIKWATPGDPTTVSALRVPQVAGGIFESNDQRTDYNVMGEDIWVDPADGAVWFQQGGQYLYFGAIRNTSRIVRFDPGTSAFSCFNVPEDDAEVGGLVVDHARNMVWYSESGWTHGNAIGGFSLTDATADCMWDPYTMPRTPSCPVDPVPGCHQRFPLPQANSSPMNMVLDGAGDLWFTEFTGNRIGRLDPDTGTIIELPLPPAIARQGPGQYFGGGPFAIDIDGNGNLWITEQFDGTITEIRPSLMATNDCTRLNALQQNPCMTEVWVGSNGFDNQGVSWLYAGLDGMVWFTVSANHAGLLSVPPVTGPNISTVGIVSTTQGNAVALLPALRNVLSTSGIAQDPVTGDVWFGEYDARQLVRLYEASGDGDAVPDARDNCPNAYNPGQENSDSIVDQTPPRTVDDKTWIRSDGLGDACDADDDNDGIADSAETAGPPCGSASGPTNPRAWDTDGDRVLDGVECALGTDPADASSRPAGPLLGTDPDRDGLSNSIEATIGTDPNNRDSDGDGVPDGVEYLYYGSDPLNRDTDADGISDACEIASINADAVVNAGDQALLASEVSRAVPYAQKVVNFDLNKDGAINAGDQAFMASKARPNACAP